MSEIFLAEILFMRKICCSHCFELLFLKQQDVGDVYAFTLSAVQPKNDKVTWLFAKNSERRSDHQPLANFL